MVRKLITCGVALTFPSACADPEDYRIGTKNGSDVHQFDVQCPSTSARNDQVKFWGKQLCPQGHTVIGDKFDSFQQSTISAFAYRCHEITIACPTR